MQRQPHHPFVAFLVTVILMLLAATATVVFDDTAKGSGIGLDFEVQSLFTPGPSTI
jgi:hypothetical protein